MKAADLMLRAILCRSDEGTVTKCSVKLKIYVIDSDEECISLKAAYVF